MSGRSAYYPEQFCHEINLNKFFRDSKQEEQAYFYTSLEKDLSEWVIPGVITCGGLGL